MYAKVKVRVSNFLLDIWRVWAFRRGNLEMPESRGYKCSPQNFIKDTVVSLRRTAIVQEHLVYLIRWCTRYTRKFFRKRHRQMRATFFNSGAIRYIITWLDCEQCEAGIKVARAHRYYRGNQNDSGMLAIWQQIRSLRCSGLPSTASVLSSRSPDRNCRRSMRTSRW